MKISKELMKGSTPLLILSLLEAEDMYGYQLIGKLKEKSDNMFALKEGTLYPLLHALENAGAISSYWFDTDEGRRRKYYKIEKAGLKLLGEKKAEWQAYASSVSKVIGGACFE